MPYLGIFRLEFKKTIVIFEISTLKFVYLQNFMEKQKCLNFGPKVPDLGILGLEFKKTIVIFEISTFGLVWLQNFVKKQKCLYLEPKMPFLGIFDPKCLIWVFLGKNLKKTIVIFEISTLKCVYLQNFTKKKQNAYIWDQKCLIWIFLDWNLKTILSYLKSAPSNLPTCKISRKNKNA